MLCYFPLGLLVCHSRFNHAYVSSPLTHSPGLAHYADGTKEERKTVHAAGADKASEAVQGDNFGGHKDSMPRGARSVGLDIAFPYAQHVYGECVFVD